MHQKVMGLIPGQGTYPGCGFNPQLEQVLESSQLMSLSLSLSPPPPSTHLLSLKNQRKKNILG